MLFAPQAGAIRAKEYIEFLYIDANVGGSSGGHAAVKLGDTVYHFQNDDGYTRLARESWTRFRFIYNDVDNRNIYSARVPVIATDAERVRDRLSLLFMVQNRHIDYLTALQQDEQMIEALADGTPVGILGSGFFIRRAHEASVLASIRANLAQHQGSDFIRTESQRVIPQLAALRYVPAPPALSPLSPDRYPVYPPTFSEQAQELYARWFALMVIEQGWPLHDEALIDTGKLESTTPRLTATERAWLERYRTSLQDGILATLAAPYPGSGKAILLSLARYQAIALSLASDRLLLLDVLQRTANPPDAALTEEDREPLQRLIRQLRTRLPALQKSMFEQPEADEAAYQRLEVAASELRGAERALRFSHAIHLSQPEGPPEGLGYAVLPIPPGSPEQSAAAGATARTRAAEFLEKMHDAYEYQLITHNCVTELAKAVNSSFQGDDETHAFGGHLVPGSAQGFVPFRFFELVRQHYRVDRVEVLLSYRNHRLNRLSQNGADWIVLARESNVLTSSIYQPREGDSAFVMFTEHGFWTRPLFGAINLGYGIGASAAGLLTAPVDRGSILMEGLRGVLFSLPELAFWTIRKGSFNEMSPRSD